MDELKIRVSNISKVYRMYNSTKDRYKEAISNGKKVYGKDYYALNNISFDVKNGEILGILGTNGSGKSTLLKIITGVLQPSEGTVTTNGKISALLELGAGFNPEYTGIENIYFNGMLMGFTKKEMDGKIQGIIDFADIGEHINQPVKTYSSGMMVRLAYSVAVSIEPDILIVDEALSVGDAYFQMKSMTKMEELFRKGKTVLFVSHDTASIRKLCTKAIWLDKGKIVDMGDSREIVDRYEEKAREEMSNNGIYGLRKKGVTVSENVKDDFSKFFSIDKAYMDRVASNREGNNKAYVCGVELVNEKGDEVSLVDCNQKVILFISIIVDEDCVFSVGYHIRDEKNEIILGSNSIYEDIGEIDAKSGEKYIARFEFSLPLREGRFNVMTVLSSTIIPNRSAEFIDITKDGLYFEVLENKPVRIWNLLQLPNKLDIFRVEDR